MGVEDAMLVRVTFDAAHEAEALRGRLVQRVAALAAGAVLVGVPAAWAFGKTSDLPVVVVAIIAVTGAGTAWLTCAMGAVILSEPLLRWSLRRQARAFGARPAMASRQLDAARAVLDEEDRARFAGDGTRPAP